jgi:hypothetical protein
VEREILRAGIHLDAGQNSLALKHLYKRIARGRFLTDGLIVENDTAHELFEAGCRDEDFTVRAAVLFGARHSHRIEALLARRRAFVGGEQPLARRDHLLGCFFEYRDVHRFRALADVSNYIVSNFQFSILNFTKQALEIEN